MLLPKSGKSERQPVKARNVVFFSLVAALLYLTWPQSLGGSIAYVKVNGHSMDGTYKSGDLIIVHQVDQYQVGDIIAYRIPKDEFGSGAQVIHRIIGGNGKTGYLTKGDNRTIKDDWYPKNGDVVGRAWVRIPGVGTWFSNLSKPIPLAVVCAGMTIFVMVLPRKDEKAKARKGPRLGPVPRVHVNLSDVQPPVGVSARPSTPLRKAR